MKLWFFPAMGIFMGTPTAYPYKSATASDIHAGGASPCLRSYALPTSGKNNLPPSRAIRATAGRAGSSVMRLLRRNTTRSTCGSARTRASSAGSTHAVSPACVVRKYSSAGSTAPSQSSTELRKEATMIAIAAMSEKLATIAARLTIA